MKRWSTLGTETHVFVFAGTVENFRGVWGFLKCEGEPRGTAFLHIGDCKPGLIPANGDRLFFELELQDGGRKWKARNIERAHEFSISAAPPVSRLGVSYVKVVDGREK